MPKKAIKSTKNQKKSSKNKHKNKYFFFHPETENMRGPPIFESQPFMPTRASLLNNDSTAASRASLVHFDLMKPEYCVFSSSDAFF